MNNIPNLEVQTIGLSKNASKVVTGSIELPCWNGFFLKEDPQYSLMDEMVTKGRIELTVDCLIEKDDSIRPTQEQVNAYTYLIEQQETIKWALLRELKEAFPLLLEEEYGSWDHEEGGFPQLADLTPTFDFKRYIGPSSIEIRDDVKDDTAYLHWYFQCRWDPEHGLQAITHKDRVIDISPDADIFKMYKDNNTYEQVEKELDNKVWKRPAQKKWWQFWKP